MTTTIYTYFQNTRGLLFFQLQAITIRHPTLAGEENDGTNQIADSEDADEGSSLLMILTM